MLAFLESKKNRLCSSHPHNYYFEILTETGIVGLFVTLMIASLFVVFILKNFKFFKGNNIENFILLAATIGLILEAFPFRSSGSIFTTNNATYIILIASIILSHKKRQIVSKRTTNIKKF
jgi:O-antigen ligase